MKERVRMFRTGEPVDVLALFDLHGRRYAYIRKVDDVYDFEIVTRADSLDLARDAPPVVEPYMALLKTDAPVPDEVEVLATYSDGDKRYAIITRNGWQTQKVDADRLRSAETPPKKQQQRSRADAEPSTADERMKYVVMECIESAPERQLPRLFDVDVDVTWSSLVVDHNGDVTRGLEKLRRDFQRRVDDDLARRNRDALVAYVELLDADAAQQLLDVIAANMTEFYGRTWLRDCVARKRQSIDDDVSSSFGTQSDDDYDDMSEESSQSDYDYVEFH